MPYLTATEANFETLDKLMEAHVDITGAIVANVQIDERSNGKIVRVNVNGICVLRICQIAALNIDDQRRR